jgi:hypothetical protein
MKDLTEYCSEELTKILVEKFDYPTNKTYWVKFSTFDYKRLAKLHEIQTWLRDEHTYHILIRHPRGFTGNGMEFWKYTYEIIVKNPENNWEGTDISKIGIFDSYEEALQKAIYDLVEGNVKLDVKYENLNKS